MRERKSRLGRQKARGLQRHRVVMTESAIHEAQEARESVRWSSGTNVLAGIWLIAAPFWLGYAGLERALANDVAVGVAIVVLGLVRAGAPLRNEALSWIVATLGVWLVAAPFVLATTRDPDVPGVAAAFWNDLLVGILVIVLASWSALTTRRARDPARRF